MEDLPVFVVAFLSMVPPGIMAFVAWWVHRDLHKRYP